jgi:hypothetical protein
MITKEEIQTILDKRYNEYECKTTVKLTLGQVMFSIEDIVDYLADNTVLSRLVRNSRTASWFRALWIVHDVISLLINEAGNLEALNPQDNQEKKEKK